MCVFTLNGKEKLFSGNRESTLLKYLREVERITSVKDGCSGEGTCGACLVEVNDRARLSCRIKMGTLSGANVVTLEGIPESCRTQLARAYVDSGAIQCGFCTPGLLMRTWILLKSNPHPSYADIRKAIKGHLCRCTGYKKIEKAVKTAAHWFQTNAQANTGADTDNAYKHAIPTVGSPYPKFRAKETALGRTMFVDDLYFDGMLYGALRLSDYPRAKLTGIDGSPAAHLPGVRKVFTALDVPGNRHTGLIVSDWPLMIAEGETTHYIGDVIAGVAANDPDTARKAARLIKIEYEVLDPITDLEEAASNTDQVHEDRGNVLETCVVRRGDARSALQVSEYIAEGRYTTQRVEHAFLEKESAVAVSDGVGVQVYSQGQGVYEDQRQIAALLDLSLESIKVTQVPTGGAFGGKEDLSVQGHAALFAYLLKKPVKLTLTRSESIIMHPKRHPVILDITVGAARDGKLTALCLRALGDTGAYASVGTKVMERVAGHAGGGYHIPAVDIETRTVYTNNIPSGAMRGFGVNQVTFAVESCVEELCRLGGFDPWQFRFDNALADGLLTVTGQKLKAVGIRDCLMALQEEYRTARSDINLCAGLAVGIKNCGIGNGMVDESTVSIVVEPAERIVIHHGWTEMGQGVNTVAVQILCQETGIDPAQVEVEVETGAGLGTGMTTASRATSLLGNAIIDAAGPLKEDLEKNSLTALAGRTYRGRFACDWTTAPGEGKVIHYSYGYAAQLCILNKYGRIVTVYAAHDAGKVVNPTLFSGQIEGAIHMGLGYALTEDLPMEAGRLVSTRLSDCGVLRAHETPDIQVKAVEVSDPVGPYGAKGIGEIGLVPTAAAVANALYAFDGVRRYSLPLERKKNRGASSH